MAWLLNALIPGTGLIIRRREWLGLALAMIHAMCGQVAIAGHLIAPQAIPPALIHLALGLGVVNWILAQSLFIHQGRILNRTDQALSDLLTQARAAMESNDLATAGHALDGALALDEENAELHVLRAGLASLKGDTRTMHGEWRRVIKLDRRKRYLTEAQNALRPDGER